jgi:hypothetical protein
MWSMAHTRKHGPSAGPGTVPHAFSVSLQKCAFYSKMGVSEQLTTTHESFDIRTRLYCLDLLTGWTWVEQAMYPSNMIFLGYYHSSKARCNIEFQRMKWKGTDTNVLEQ